MEGSRCLEVNGSTVGLHLGRMSSCTYTNYTPDLHVMSFMSSGSNCGRLEVNGWYCDESAAVSVVSMPFAAEFEESLSKMDATLNNCGL